MDALRINDTTIPIEVTIEQMMVAKHGGYDLGTQERQEAIVTNPLEVITATYHLFRNEINKAGCRNVTEFATQIPSSEVEELVETMQDRITFFFPVAKGALIRFRQSLQVSEELDEKLSGLMSGEPLVS